MGRSIELDMLECSILIFAIRRDGVVNLQYHPTELRRQQELLPLSNQRIDDEEISHVVRAGRQTVNAEARVALLDLPRLDICKRLYRGKSRVLGQGGRNSIECIRECPHSVLLNPRNLVCLLGYLDGAGHLGGASAVDYSVVLHQISHHTEGIVQSSLCFIHNLVMSAR